MILIDPSHTIVKQVLSTDVSTFVDNILKHTERIGRVCYKSEDNIKDESAFDFIKKIVYSGHTSILAHGAVYLKFNHTFFNNLEIADLWIKFYEDESKFQYRRIVEDEITGDMYVYTNLRYLLENCTELYKLLIIDKQLPKDIELFIPEQSDENQLVSVQLITDIGVSRELNRHTSHYITEQSTRYCNFSKDKFGKQLTFIVPNWTSTISTGQHEVNWKGLIGDCKSFKTKNKKDNLWFWNSTVTERDYMKLIDEGCKAQEARQVLSLDVKTELYHTTYLNNWIGGNLTINNPYEESKKLSYPKGFFPLRTAPSAHPQMRQLIIPLKEEFKKIFNL